MKQAKKLPEKVSQNKFTGSFKASTTKDLIQYTQLHYGAQK
tara:strand:+ start:49 stop:171 length:123 start_codon:yes stop_codon:yes gene_type:complete